MPVNVTVKGTKYPPFRFPADSKQPMIAGVVMTASLIWFFASDIVDFTQTYVWSASPTFIMVFVQGLLSDCVAPALFLGFAWAQAKKKPTMEAVPIGYHLAGSSVAVGSACILQFLAIVTSIVTSRPMREISTAVTERAGSVVPRVFVQNAGFLLADAALWPAAGRPEPPGKS
ncbi:MAG: hypothetical protein LBJ11_11610 [Oscillospiraceae bacterium]|nr:hypothetical protein [Oscillospiraceae bacterium]